MNFTETILRLLGRENKQPVEQTAAHSGKSAAHLHPDVYVLNTKHFMSSPSEEYVGQPYVDMLQELLTQISGHFKNLTYGRRIFSPHDLEDRMVQLLEDIEGYYRSLGNQKKMASNGKHFEKAMAEHE